MGLCIFKRTYNLTAPFREEGKLSHKQQRVGRNTILVHRKKEKKWK